MKNLNFKLLIVFMLSVVLSSCLNTEAVDFGKGPRVLGFKSAKASKNFLQDGTAKVYDLELDLVYLGGDNKPMNEAVTVTIAVDATNTTASSAQYSLDKTEFIIPAGKNSVKAIVKVNSGTLDSNDPKVLAIKIAASSDNANVSNNTSSTQVTLQAICPSALANTYEYTDGSKAGREVIITEEEAGVYKVSADNSLRGEYFFKISDVCGKLTVTGGQTDDMGYPVSGTGTVNADGTITISYTVKGIFTAKDMNMKLK